MDLELLASREGEMPFVTAFARGLAIIEAFGERRSESTLAELARRTNLSRATVRRCLHTLVSLGYARIKGRQFALTPKIMSLGFSYLAASPLPRLAQPFLERLSERTGACCSMSVLEDGAIVYVASTAALSAERDRSVGTRQRAGGTAMGTVLLGALPQKEARLALAGGTSQHPGPSQSENIEALLTLTRKAARDGYAFADTDPATGLRSVAVPVYGSDGMVLAAMDVSVNAARMETSSLMGPTLDALKQSSEALRTALREAELSRQAAL